MTNKLQDGQIYRYPFNWLRQAKLGLTEGEKSRPCCLTMKVLAGTETWVYFLPISSSPPLSGDLALEIPPIEIKRAGLSEFKKAWIYFEFNKDILEKSWYFNASEPPIGAVSPAFFARVVLGLRAAAKVGRLSTVNRRT